MKKPLLFLIIGILIGVSGVYGLRGLKKIIKSRHVQQVEAAKADWLKQADTQPWSNSDFRNRFTACDDELLLTYFNLKRNRDTQTVKAEVNEEIWNRFLLLFDQWPQGLKNYCQRYVSHVYVVSQLGSSAYVLEQNDTSFIILIDSAAIEKRPNDWFTSKEASAIDLSSAFTINHRIETDANNQPEFTLETLLIHEVAHCIGVTTGQTRKFDGTWRKLEQNLLLKDVFEITNRSLKMTDNNQAQFGGLKYYRNKRISVDEYIERLSALRDSPFPTMYSSVSDLEYFADFFYAYVHCVVQQRPLEYAVFKNEEEVISIQSGISLPHHKHRRDLISSILLSLENE